MSLHRYDDNVYEIMKSGMPDGALVELNAVEGPYSSRPQPLLEAVWYSEDSRFVFVSYAKGIELPFEVVEALVRTAREWLPPSDNASELAR